MVARSNLDLAANLREAELPLIRLAVDLGAAEFGGPLTDAERRLVAAALGIDQTSEAEIAVAARAIQAGADPLGAACCRLRSPANRRTQGAFYTPPEIVRPMVEWVLRQDPDRVDDPGCGSGRFAAAVARARPSPPIVAVDLDPAATLLTRTTLGLIGAKNVTVLQADYTDVGARGRESTGVACIGVWPTR